MPRYLLSVLGNLIIVGSFFLPWFTITLKSETLVFKGSGMEHFFLGIIGAGLLAVLAVAAFFQRDKDDATGFAFPVVLFCGVAALCALGWFDFTVIGKKARLLAAPEPNMTYGLYLAGFGALLVIVETLSVFFGILEKRQEQWEKVHGRTAGRRDDH